MKSYNNLPDKWKPRFILSYIGGEVEISQKENEEITKAITNNQDFISINGVIVRVRTIGSIRPKWSPINRPPCPTPTGIKVVAEESNKKIYVYENQEEIDEWHKFFDNEEGKHE